MRTTDIDNSLPRIVEYQRLCGESDLNLHLFWWGI